MSAFIVSDEQINTIVSYAAKHGLIGLSTMKATAAMLYKANVESVNYRYDEHTKTTGFKFVPVDIKDIADVTIAKLCDCLDYQSCELKTWPTSEACKLVEKIRKHAGGLDIGRDQQPGYNEAPWTISGPF